MKTRTSSCKITTLNFTLPLSVLSLEKQSVKLTLRYHFTWNQFLLLLFANLCADFFF